MWCVPCSAFLSQNIFCCTILKYFISYYFFSGLCSHFFSNFHFIIRYYQFVVSDLQHFSFTALVDLKIPCLIPINEGHHKAHGLRRFFLSWWIIWGCLSSVMFTIKTVEKTFNSVKQTYFYRMYIFWGIPQVCHLHEQKMAKVRVHLVMFLVGLSFIVWLRQYWHS